MANQIDVLRRFKEDLFRFRTDKELAEYVGIPQSTISTWWKRDICDLWVLVSHLGEFSADYLLSGEGPKKLKDRCGSLMINNQQGTFLSNQMDAAKKEAQESVNKLEADKQFLQAQLGKAQDQIAALQSQLAELQRQNGEMIKVLIERK